MQQPVQQPQIDLKNTSAIKTSNDTSIFQQGVILRTVSKFVMGTDEDALLPIPVFYDSKTMKIVESSIPKELREEYKEETL
jgi:hypothetical protein|tara:strand:- start:212 stop:454 length:243 start_codon:yes stop_codon:yes gene_type:complete